MKNFRTFHLAVNFYQQIKCHKLSTPLRDQLERASQSIALNLAEGYGRGSPADQKRFYQIAMGSLRECQAILLLAGLEGSQAWKTLDSLGAHLFKLIYRA
jgi:four helix bundle protein